MDLQQRIAQLAQAIGGDIKTTLQLLGDVPSLQTQNTSNLVSAINELQAKLASVSSDKTYDHTQGVASDLWAIPHGLGKYPNIVVIDSAGDEVEGDISYVDMNNITIRFSAAMSGKAYLN